MRTIKNTAVKTFLTLYLAGLIFAGYSLSATLESRPHTEECNFSGHAYTCRYTDLTEEESKLELVFAVYLYSTPYILVSGMWVLDKLK